VDPTAPALVERLAGLPGGASVLRLPERFEGLWLVGGAVRDVLLGAPVRDLDIAVEGDVEPVAEALGEILEAHGRFGTAEVRTPDGGRVNLARTRAETYAAPGALPDVRPAGIEEDLARRDFTVNAIAAALDGSQLRAVPHAREDLDARVLRVLHPRSFEDDPTRLLRLARYETRLGLAVEPETASLARAATLRTVSGDRVGNEVRLALAEPDPVASLGAAARWGGPPVPAPDEALATAGLALLPADGRPDLLVLGAAGADERHLLDLGFRSGDARRAAAAGRARELERRLRAARRPSDIAAAARGEMPEAVALAGALGAQEAARAWLEDLRHVRLGISGRDLLEAGVPEGPEVGRRLEAVLARRLDGELAPSREAELAAALAA